MGGRPCSALAPGACRGADRRRRRGLGRSRLRAVHAARCSSNMRAASDRSIQVTARALGRAEEEGKSHDRRRPPFAPTTDTRKEKMEEAESNTLASLRSGAMSILEAIAVELPDVFAVEILPGGPADTLSLAQVSKRYGDAVWA